MRYWRRTAEGRVLVGGWRDLAPKIGGTVAVAVAAAFALTSVYAWSNGLFSRVNAFHLVVAGDHGRGPSQGR